MYAHPRPKGPAPGKDGAFVGSRPRDESDRFRGDFRGRLRQLRFDSAQAESAIARLARHTLARLRQKGSCSVRRSS